jgi:hypothetical protein
MPAPAPAVAKRPALPRVVRIRFRDEALFRTVRLLVQTMKRRPEVRRGLAWAFGAFLLIAMGGAVVRNPGPEPIALTLPAPAAYAAPKAELPPPKPVVAQAPLPSSADRARIEERPAALAETPVIAVRVHPPRRVRRVKRQARRTHVAHRTAPEVVFKPARLTVEAPPAALPEPPDLRPPATADALPTIGAILTTPIPTAPDRFVNVHVNTAARPGRRFPLLGKSNRGAAYTAPAPIREHLPEVSADLRRRVAHQVPIDVKVFVDATGKVEYAELLSSGAGPNRELAMLAVFASRRWQFSPANLNGAPVPAEIVLQYRFGPTAQ